MGGAWAGGLCPLPAPHVLTAGLELVAAAGAEGPQTGRSMEVHSHSLSRCDTRWVT